MQEEDKNYSQHLEKLVRERTERLEYAYRQLAAINSVSNRFTLIYNEDELLEEAPVWLTQSLDFDRAMIWLKKNGQLILRSYCFSKDPPELIQNFMDMVNQPDFKLPPQFEECIRENKTLFIPDLNRNPSGFNNFAKVLPTKAIVMTPIKIKKEPIGLILGNMQHHDRNMDALDVARFEMFANMVGLALDNIRAYHTLERKVIERTRCLRQTNRELRQKARELEKAHRKLKQTHAQLVQAEKMAALGMLVAGIAHEINTPIGSIHSMHDTTMRTLKKLKQLLKSQFQDPILENPKIMQSLEAIENANQIIEMACERVINIVKRLRSFARLDEAEMKMANIHEGIEDTLTLIQHEIKRNIKIIKNYGEIPPVACYPGRLNQVFLNLLINAKQAIRKNGEIRITTWHQDDKVYIEFKDNGVGIPEDHLKHIFDPGFTTKGVGVGTGLGLSICHQIIKEDHHGQILVESEVGKGTTFTIILPTHLK